MMTIQQAFDLALQHHQAGRLADAEALYRQILAVQPRHVDALHYLGVIAYQAGRNDVAVALICQAIAIDASDPAAHSNLGEAYRALGRLADAVVSYHRAIQLKPDYAEAANNLGNALREQGGLREAIAQYRRALELRPDYPEAHNNLGAALTQQGQLDEAIAAFRRALELKPDFPEAHNNLGNAFRERGDLDGAIAAYRQSLRLRPEDAGVHSNLICLLHFHPRQNDHAIAAEHQRWNRQFAEPLKQFVRPQANERSPERRLRIGYVSPDFREHVVGRNLVPLFAGYDHWEFEILCYSGVLQEDRLTGEFRRQADQWRSTVAVGDEALAEMIRRDGVDILVDLTQHLEGNRLPVFARKPAPVQVSFAGYPASSGVETIDYRISDRYLEGSEPASPGRKEQRGGEEVFLIDSFWCYDPCGIEIQVNDLPAKEKGRVTFGSLNTFCKINDEVLKLWARVLGQVKDSRLMLRSGVGSHREQTLEFLQREGVEARRVEFVEPRPRKAYLELYHRLDIMLDSFPYNGHTTSLDALWMGVPVVSLAGKTPVSRAGLSQLTNLGLSELVAFSEDDYVKIAVQLAGDLSRLAELRRTLRGRMEASVLMDAPRFARQMEAAYRAMWRRWCTEKADS